MDPALRLTRLSELGNGVTLYGLQYPGFHGCVSWCYLTIGQGVIVATRPEHCDCGSSITNIWDEYFFRSLQSLQQVAEVGPSVRRFEHYHETKEPEIDEVFATQEGRVSWKFCAKGLVAVAAVFHSSGRILVCGSDDWFCHAVWNHTEKLDHDDFSL
jgi:hypothetical protein